MYFETSFSSGIGTDGEDVRCRSGYSTRAGFVPGPLCRYNSTKLSEKVKELNADRSVHSTLSSSRQILFTQYSLLRTHLRIHMLSIIFPWSWALTGCFLCLLILVYQFFETTCLLNCWALAIAVHITYLHMTMLEPQSPDFLTLFEDFMRSAYSDLYLILML